MQKKSLRVVLLVLLNLLVVGALGVKYLCGDTIRLIAQVSEERIPPGVLQEALDKTKFYAHRGLSRFAPENSILAAQVAQERGFLNLEVDIMSTKDHQLILFHDITLDRIAGNGQQVCDLSLEELREHKPSRMFFKDIFGLSERVVLLLEQIPDPWIQQLAATQIATLDELFSSFGNSFNYHLDIKNLSCGNDLSQSAQALLDLISKHGLEENVIIESTSFVVLRTFRYLNSKVRLLFWDSQPSANSQDKREQIETIGVEALDFDYSLYSQTALQAFENIKLHTYTINSFPLIMKYYDAFDYIITDLDLLVAAPLDRYAFFNQKAQDISMYSLLDADRSSLPSENSGRLLHSGPSLILFPTNYSKRISESAQETPPLLAQACRIFSRVLGKRCIQWFRK